MTGPGDWKGTVDRFLTVLRQTQELVAQITDQSVREEIISNLDNHIVELERLTFAPELSPFAQPTVVNALDYLEHLILTFPDLGIISPEKPDL